MSAVPKNDTESATECHHEYQVIDAEDGIYYYHITCRCVHCRDVVVTHTPKEAMPYFSAALQQIPKILSTK